MFLVFAACLWMLPLCLQHGTEAWLFAIDSSFGSSTPAALCQAPGRRRRKTRQTALSVAPISLQGPGRTVLHILFGSRGRMCMSQTMVWLQRVHHYFSWHHYYNMPAACQAAADQNASVLLAADHGLRRFWLPDGACALSRCSGQQLRIECNTRCACVSMCVCSTPYSPCAATSRKFHVSAADFPAAVLVQRHRLQLLHLRLRHRLLHSIHRALPAGALWCHAVPAHDTGKNRIMAHEQSCILPACSHCSRFFMPVMMPATGSTCQTRVHSIRL